MPFYIGLSILSNKALQSQEGLQLLSHLDTLGTSGACMETSGGDPSPDRLRARLGIEREAGGRPYFRDRRGDFSVSHSGGLCAAAYVTGPSRLGCDVEMVKRRRNYLSIAEMFYYKGEFRYIREAREEEEGIRRFIRIWVLKESYLKLRGLSIAKIREAPEFAFDNPEAPPRDLEIFLWELEFNREEYCLGIILENRGASLPEFIIPETELARGISIREISNIGARFYANPV